MALTRITKGVIKPNENYDTHNINSTGIVTAIGLDINGNGDISGNLSVGGVLTYEDVTSIDSVGIITAQKDIHVGAGVSVVGVGTFGGLVSPYADIDDFLDVGSNIQLGNAGVGTFSGLDISGDIDVDGHTNLDNVSIAGVSTFASSIYVADSIIHQGDTDTKIDFSPNDIRTTVANKLRIHHASNGLNYFNGNNISQATSTHTKLAGSDYVHRFRDEEGDDTLVQFFNTNVKNTVLEWNDYGNTTAAGNLIFKGIVGGSGLEHARFTGSGNFNLLRDLDVDGHTNLDNVSIAGVTTATENINIDADNKKLQIGDGQDFQLYWDGSDALIDTPGSGRIRLRSPETRFENWNGLEVLARFVGGATGRVELYHDNGNKKFETTSTGVQIDTILKLYGAAGNPGKLQLQEGGALSEIRVERSTDTSSALLFGTEISGTTATRAKIDTAGHFIPATDSDYDLGLNGTRWRNLYADTLYGDGSNLTGITQTTINSNTNNYIITGTGTANTLQGESSFRYDGNGGLDMEGTGSSFFQIKTPDSTDGGIYFRTGTTNYGAISYLHNSTPSSGRMNFRSGGTTKMDLVGAGHLGVGANNLTKTWSSGKAIHIGDSENAIWGEGDNAVHLMQNAYYNSGYKYTHSDEATVYTQEDGSHRFKVTASGSADSAITWTEALRIESDGGTIICNAGTFPTSTNETVHIQGEGHNGHGTSNTRSVFNITGAITSNTSAAGLWIGARTNTNTAVIGTRTSTGNLAFETYSGGWGERMRLTYNGSLNIGGDFSQSTYTMKVTGSFAATTKSFVIDHPTKENHSLRYACLEGPENSVYVRGKTSDPVIELPDYWKGLVHEDSITVNVTPIGNHKVWVESINNNSITIGSDGSEYFYTVFAERKDVDKLEVEVAK